MKEDYLFELIKTLSKAEKRQFRLFANRLNVNLRSQYMEIYNRLEKSNSYKKFEIKAISTLNQKQVSNLKRYLYYEILEILQNTKKDKSVVDNLNKYINLSKILLKKGLISQSKKLIKKAEKIAQHYNQISAQIEIIQLRQLHFNRLLTKQNLAEFQELEQKEERLFRSLELIRTLSSVERYFHHLVQADEYPNDKKGYEQIKRYFTKNIPKINIHELCFFEKKGVFQVELWKAVLFQDYKACYRALYRWGGLYQKNKHMIAVDPLGYLRFKNYFLELLYHINHIPLFKRELNKMEAIIKSSHFPKDNPSNAMAFIYLFYNKLNLSFISGCFFENEYLVELVNEGIAKYSHNITKYQELVFYYKIACLYFGMNKLQDAIHYLDKVINNKDSLDQDLIYFSRLLSVIAHYEAGLDDTLERDIEITSRLLKKIKGLKDIQKEIISFLYSLGDVYPQDIKKAFIAFRAKLLMVKQQPQKRRAFLYFDIISWLESKISGQTVDLIIKEKAKQK